MKRQNIEANRWYSLLEIRDHGLFPWCKTVSSIRRYIDEDKEGADILKTLIVGSGRSKRYQIRGANIIKYLAQFESEKK